MCSSSLLYVSNPSILSYDNFFPQPILFNSEKNYIRSMQHYFYKYLINFDRSRIPLPGQILSILFSCNHKDDFFVE